MPYQNNNNRIVPQKVGLTNIKPVAHNVDTMIRYTPHTEAIANNYRGISQAIRDIGKGLYDINNALTVSAQANAAKMIMNDNLIKNNKHQWQEASRNVEGAAKYNPYLKESYKQLAANDVAQQLLYEAATVQNPEQMTPEGYQELMNLQRGKFLDYCRENNIPTRLAGGAIIGLQNNLNQLSGRQQAANAQYTYDVTLAAGNNEALTQLRGIAYTLKGEEKTQAITQFFTNYADTLSANGIPPKDIYNKCIKPTLANFIKQTATDEDVQTSLADIINSVKEANKLNGINLDVLDPDWEYKARQLYKNTKLEQFHEVQQEYQIEKYKQARQEEEDKNTFFNWFIDNPNASIDEINEKIIEVSKNSPDLLLSLTHSMKGYIDTQKSYETRVSNPDVVDNLIVATVNGTLTPEMLVQAMPELSQRDTLTYFSYLKSQEQAKANQEKKQEQEQLKEEEAKEKASEKTFKAYSKDVINQLTGKKGTDSSLLKQLNNLDKITKGYSNDFLVAVNDIHKQINDGEISYQEGLNRLQLLVKDVENKAKRLEQIQNAQNDSAITGDFKPIDVLSKSKRQLMQLALIEDYNIKSATEAIRKMGILPNNMAVNITSTIQKKRSFDNRPHQAYDIAIPEGTPLKLPKGVKYGVVVASGFEKNLGNYALIQLGRTGEQGYIRLAHCKQVFKSGTELGAGTTMAVSGNTGFSTGSHLDIEFWKPNVAQGRMLATQFLAQINGANDPKQKEKIQRGFNS